MLPLLFMFCTRTVKPRQLSTRCGLRGGAARQATQPHAATIDRDMQAMHRLQVYTNPSLVLSCTNAELQPLQQNKSWNPNNQHALLHDRGRQLEQFEVWLWNIDKQAWAHARHSPGGTPWSGSSPAPAGSTTLVVLAGWTAPCNLGSQHAVHKTISTSLHRSFPSTLQCLVNQGTKRGGHT